MFPSSRPMFVIHVAWHPAYAAGAGIAKGLHEHYRRKPYDNVVGGAGLSVLYRFAPAAGGSAPVPIDMDEAEATAIVVLLDEHFLADADYLGWYRTVAGQADAVGMRSRVFPIVIGDDAMARCGIVEQGIRWDRWSALDENARALKLKSSLTHQFCRMIRWVLHRLTQPDDEEIAFERYLEPVQVFLSHSKRDADGQRIAGSLRERLSADGLASFFDVHDIPPGVPFDKVLMRQVRVSAVIAIHTDSFSSREWCRREIIEAKRWNVPLVTANCISDLDERSFPYMGNVPVVRMDPVRVDRIDQVIACLLDQVLQHFLWGCRTALAGDVAAEVTFLPRAPELVSLAGLQAGTAATFVYPDPPLGAEEMRLFEAIAPTVRLSSVTEWLASGGA